MLISVIHQRTQELDPLTKKAPPNMKMKYLRNSLITNRTIPLKGRRSQALHPEPNKTDEYGIIKEKTVNMTTKETVWGCWITNAKKTGWT